VSVTAASVAPGLSLKQSALLRFEENETWKPCSLIYKVFHKMIHTGIFFDNISATAEDFTRRPAFADRTARRKCQATGQPVSRTQDSDAMRSRLPRYEAKCVQRTCFHGGRSLCVQILSELSYPLPIYWYHSKGNWLRYNFAADSFYIMKRCSRLLVLYCRNCPKDDKFRYLIPILRKLGAA